MIKDGEVQGRNPRIRGVKKPAHGARAASVKSLALAPQEVAAFMANYASDLPVR
jgi:hypothetical protein